MARGRRKEDGAIVLLKIVHGEVMRRGEKKTDLHALVV